MLASLSFAVLALGAPIQAPRDTTNLSAPTCRSCRLTRAGSLVIRDERLIQQAAGNSVVVRHDGGVVIGDVDRPDPVLLLVRGNERRVLAGTGDGPGEIRRLAAVAVDPLDSLFVFDVGGAKVSVFAPDGRFVRAAPIPASTMAATILADHRLLLVQVNSAPRTGGHLLLVMRADGEPEALWREPDPQLGPAMVRSNRRLVLGLPDSGALVQRRSRAPLFEQRAADGRIRRVWRRETPLLVPSNPGDNLQTSPTQAPSWFGQGMGRLDDSLVVMAWTVPDADWARGLGPLTAVEGGSMYPIVDQDKAYDTMVDIVNWRTGVLVASARWDEYFTGVTADGRLILNRIDPDPQTELVALRLTIL